MPNFDPDKLEKEDKTKKQFESLAEFIKDRDPKKIGINVSAKWRFGDGLTAALRDNLVKALNAAVKMVRLQIGSEAILSAIDRESGSGNSIAASADNRPKIRRVFFDPFCQAIEA